MQTVVPMLTYEDVAAAAEWLCRVFDFRETGERYSDEQGRVTHAEVSFGEDGLVMLGFASPDYRGPRRHAEECEQARRWLDNPYAVDGVHVQVEGLDEHHPGPRRRRRDPARDRRPAVRPPLHSGRSGRAPLDVLRGQELNPAKSATFRVCAS